LWKNQADAGVLRIGTIFGQTNSLDESQLLSIAKLLLDGRESTVDDTQIIFPTYANDVGLIVRGLCERKIQHCGLYGTWHWSGTVGVTLYNLTVEISKILGVSDAKISPMKESKVVRPQNTELNCIALEVMGLGKSTPLKEALAQVLAQFRK